MNDLKSLRQKAEAANNPDKRYGWWQLPVVEDNTTFEPEICEYIAAASPDVILELLDLLEGYEKDAERYRWLRQRCAEEDGGPYIVFYDSVSGVESPIWNDIADSKIDRAMQG